MILSFKIGGIITDHTHSLNRYGFRIREQLIVSDLQEYVLQRGFIHRYIGYKIGIPGLDTFYFVEHLRPFHTMFLNDECQAPLN